MISAADALLLPSAQLTAQEQQRAALLATEVATYISAHMEYSGCHGFRTSEPSGNVVAEVNRRLRGQNWLTNWQPLYGKPVGGKQELNGWALDLTPRDDAYAEAKARGGN